MSCQLTVLQERRFPFTQADIEGWVFRSGLSS